MKHFYSVYICDYCGKSGGCGEFPLGWYYVNSLSHGNSPHPNETHLRENFSFCEECGRKLVSMLNLLELKYNYRVPQTDLTKPIEPGNILVME